jgi:SAM-dependent methyltransferase
MDLPDLQKVWDDWAEADALWAILSDPTKAGGKWDVDEFFATGREEIKAVMDAVAVRNIRVAFGRSLDFGCGVGRLTQALADYFQLSEGIDISATMIRKAEALNRSPRCRFYVNDRSDLAAFGDGSFDFIYSNIVLQHMEPELSEGYVREFVRVLADGGVAVFQVPSEYLGPPPDARLPEGAHLTVIDVDDPPSRLTVGSRMCIDVQVRNAGQATWPKGVNLRLGNRWLEAAGGTLISDDGRTELPLPLAPGEVTPVALTVEAPQQPGRYLMEIDLVEEGVSWFADRGSPTVKVPVRVTKPSRLSRIVTRRSEVPAAEGHPPLFTMHALHRDRVVAAVTASGGHVLDIEEYNPSGVGWESFRYFVGK